MFNALVNFINDSASPPAAGYDANPGTAQLEFIVL